VSNFGKFRISQPGIGEKMRGERKRTGREREREKERKTERPDGSETWDPPSQVYTTHHLYCRLPRARPLSRRRKGDYVGWKMLSLGPWNHGYTRSMVVPIILATSAEMRCCTVCTLYCTSHQRERLD
jgi:hypothetical protein